MKKKTTRKNNSEKWFIKVRGSYLPSSSVGWLSYIPYLAYTIGITGVVLHEQYDFITATLLLVPNWVAAAVVMQWFACNHS